MEPAWGYLITSFNRSDSPKKCYSNGHIHEGMSELCPPMHLKDRIIVHACSGASNKGKEAWVSRNKSCTKHVALPISCGKVSMWKHRGNSSYYLGHRHHRSFKRKGGSGAQE